MRVTAPEHPEVPLRSSPCPRLFPECQQLPHTHAHQCCPFLCRKWSSSRSLGPGWQKDSWGETRVEPAEARTAQEAWGWGRQSPFLAQELQWGGRGSGKGRLCCHHVANTESSSKPSPSPWPGKSGEQGGRTEKSSQTHIFSISSFSSSAPGRSRLLPRTKTYRGGQRLGPGLPGQAVCFLSPPQPCLAFTCLCPGPQ